MLKKISLLVLIVFLSFGCGIDNAFLKDGLFVKSKNNTFDSLDIAKAVEIKVLNPTNKSTVEWYKKDEKNIVMKVGSQAEIIGTVILKDDTKSSNVTWSSADSTIAVVNNGKISANKLGITTILAVSNLDTAYKGLLNVEVVDPANFSSSDSKSINSVKSMVSYVSINGKNYVSLSMGLNQSISALATVTLSDGQKVSNVIWESSDENIAVIDTNGKITSKKAGNITIVAKYRLNPDFKSLIDLDISDVTSVIGKEIYNSGSGNNIILPNSVSIAKTDSKTSYSEPVKLKDLPVAKIQIPADGDLVISEGEKSPNMTAIVTYIDNSIDGNVKWSSSDSTIATVNEVSGSVSGVKEGTVTIIAASMKDPNQRASIRVTVRKSFNDPLSSYISLNGKKIDTLRMKMDETQTLQATIKLSNGTYAPNVTWTSSDSTVVNVRNGNLSALKYGVATITASAREENLTKLTSIKVIVSDILDSSIKSLHE